MATGNDDAVSSATEFLLREMDFHIDALSSLRTAVATVIGVGTTIAVGLTALAFRDRRSPEPGWAVGLGFAFIVLAWIAAAIVTGMVRSSVDWPHVSDAAVGSGGSAIDLREQFLTDLQGKVTSTRERSARLDWGYGAVVVLITLALLSWVLVLARTPVPPSSAGVSSTTTSVPGTSTTTTSVPPSTSAAGTRQHP